MARLSKEQWVKAQAEWENDHSTTFEALARSLGCSKTAVSLYAKRNGWAREGVNAGVNPKKVNVNVNIHANSASRISRHAPDPVSVTVLDGGVSVLDSMFNRGSGPSPSYHEGLADLAYKFCLLGATNKRLAMLFGVHEETIARWINQHDEFYHAVRRGREIADAEVAQSLYRRATGYSFRSEKIFNANGEILRADTIEHCPPDVAAIKMWLLNRSPESWKEKIEVTVEDATVDTPEMIEARNQRYMKAMENAARGKEAAFERCRQLYGGNVTIDNDTGAIEAISQYEDDT